MDFCLSTVVRDRSFLFDTIGRAYDSHGLYVENIEYIRELVHEGTKASLIDGVILDIKHWFSSGVYSSTRHKGKDVFDLVMEHPTLLRIAKKYDIDLNACPKEFTRV